jgi:large subunit ribosomal protein L24
MKEFSKHWISSKKPNKQRKYRFNAPLHIRGDFMNVHLSKDLRSKQGTRAVRVRTGDKVRVMRGQFKGQEGKVEEVNMKTLKVYVEKVSHTKRDGTKARYPIQPSNLLLVELFSDDKKRFAKKSEKPAKAAKPVAEKKAPVKKAAAKPKAAKKEE